MYLLLLYRSLKRYAWYDNYVGFHEVFLLKKENMSLFQQHLVLLASLLDNLQNCWVVT
ncbi:hypothetical protein CFP56_006169 [Quercus suber]|uniref:Maturase K n=1 Tax=Quercus suber TaxID=58331 RepID=A0AAW0LAK6_QUESU